MKDKGFTLIEMLTVVAVLGVLGVIVTVSLTSTLRQVNEKKCEAFVEEIESAACSYAGLSTSAEVCQRPSCTVSLSTLIGEGLVTNEKDDCTGENVDETKTITITWDDEGKKICTYNGVKNYAR